MNNQDLLDECWEDGTSTNVCHVDISNNGDALTLEVGESYLFVHTGIVEKALRTLDDYWKGRVEAIKIHPRLHVLLQVRWFWSKQDVQNHIRGKPRRQLSLILNSMAEQELFASDTVSIACSSSVEDVVNVIMLGDGQKQGPVSEYFFRLLWKEQDATLHGDPPFGCGLSKCKRVWAPDKEEQRYCFLCELWYHVDCLTAVKGITQEQLLESRALDGGYGPLPTVLLETGLQPVARGGERHFTAGNIRMVAFSRLLLEEEDRRTEFAGNAQLDGEAWTKLLETEFGIGSKEPADEWKEAPAKEWKEALFTGNQSIYKCPNCPMGVEI